MNTRTPPIPFHLPGYAGIVLCSALAMTGAAMLSAAVQPAREVTAPASSAVNRIVRWHERGRDRLRVTLRTTREVVIYDAATGEPLQRFAPEAASAPSGLQAPVTRRGPAFASR